MATFTESNAQIRKEFNHLNQIFTQLKQQFFANDARFNVISMGMSGDYPIAIEEGATIIRVGTLIFGERGYWERNRAEGWKNID